MTTQKITKNLKAGQKLQLSVNGSHDYFGEDVAIDGDYTLVADRSNGKAYMYRWHDGQWQLQQELLRQVEQGCSFSFRAAISGNFAIVGHGGAKPSGTTEIGAAHIYELKDGQWQHQQILKSSDIKTGDYFGCSVAIDGKVAIVGASYADAPDKDNCGAVYIFHLENGKWVQKDKLQPLDLGAKDHFGRRVSISGNVIIAGAWNASVPDKDHCGAAYIFHLENGKWVQQNKLQPLDLASDDNFGYPVAVAGNLAIVGACYADFAGKTDAGVAYIYQLQDGQWQLHQKIQATDPNNGDRFGYSVSIDGDVAVVGAKCANASGKTECGAAYLFQLVNGKWQQQQKLQPEDLPAGGKFGQDISFDGRRAIISSSGSEENPEMGFAYIYDVTDEE